MTRRNPSNSESVAPEKPNLTAAAPVCATSGQRNSRSGSLLEIQLMVRLRLRRAQKAASAELAVSPPVPKKKKANPTGGPAAIRSGQSRCLAHASHKCRHSRISETSNRRSQIAAVSPDSKAAKSRIERREREATQTPAPKRSAMTGTFAGQLFGYSRGHIFSSDLILTLVGPGKK